LNRDHHAEDDRIEVIVDDVVLADHVVVIVNDLDHHTGEALDLHPHIFDVVLVIVMHHGVGLHTIQTTHTNPAPIAIDVMVHEIEVVLRDQAHANPITIYQWIQLSVIFTRVVCQIFSHLVRWSRLTVCEDDAKAWSISLS
uniref:Elongation factor Tu n=1 Tax=Echinostoma caproni TaxID=27848 RepID=A0A183BD34_9TREM